MTARELLERLEQVRAAGERAWKARCPAHADASPSLTVTEGDDGKVLVHCHAGCDVTAIVEALGLTVADLFRANACERRPRTTTAQDLPAVADWLRSVRKIAEAEIGRMHARDTKRGPAVAFRYQDISGRTLYEKFRPIAGKTFWRSPTGASSVLYGLPDAHASDHKQVIITEGELDAHALRGAGFSPVVSLPDGAGSRLTPDLLAPLDKFGEILIATDADDVGEQVATRLALALVGRRSLRVRFRQDDGYAFKDAGEARQAGWTHDHFAAALAKAEPIAEVAPANDNAHSESPYRVVDGALCHVRIDRQQNETVQRLTNFSATIDEQTTRDDGTDATTFFTISGRLASGTPLPPIQVPTSEYGAIGWVSKWGHGPTVFAGTGKRDHVRVAIDLLSKPVRRCTYAHTGWRKIDGRWVFLFHGGAVGADDVAVSLDPPLDRVALPPAGGDPVEAMRWSLRLLSCAPFDVTVPLFGAIYAAPLSLVLNPDCTVWLVGTTGSYKSELAALAQRHYGEFDRTRLPASWCSTEAAIEYTLSVMKDVVCVVDDYAPQPDIRSQQDQAKRAEHIIRNVSNRSSRERMRADLTHRPSRPPRGLVISTGEDVPRSPSIQARLVAVQVDKDRVDLQQLTALQENGHQFAHAMRAFIDQLRPQLDDLHRTLPGVLAKARDDFRQAGVHARQPSALALLYVGFDLGLQYAMEIGAIGYEEWRRLTTQGRDALLRLGIRQARDQDEIDPAERFVEVVREELAQGRVILCERDNSGAQGPGEAETIGYCDDENAYLLPEISRKRVSTCLRAAGEAWTVTAKTLHLSLVKKKIVIPGPEGRPETKRTFGGKRLRVLTVPLSILWDHPAAPRSAPPLLPANETGAASGDPTSWRNKGFDASAPVAPLAPSARAEGAFFAAEEE